MIKINLIFSKAITFNTFFDEICKDLEKLNSKIKIWCVDPENITLDYPKQKIDLPNNWLTILNPIKFINFLYKIRKQIKNSENEIFILNTPLAAHFFRIASINLTINKIYFVHGFRFHKNEIFFLYYFHYFIEYLLSKFTDKYIVINNEDMQIVNNDFKKKILKINGVGVKLRVKDFDQFDSKRQKISIGVLAAYRKNKGYDEIIKISSILRKIDFFCYGYDNRNKYQKKINKLKLKNISLNNFDPKLRYKNKKYNLLLHLSKREGLCVSIMESLKQGIPVIAYDIRGVNDLIKNGFNGFLFNFNQTDKIVEKINELNSDRKLYNEISKNCKDSIDITYSSKHIAKKIIDFTR